MTSEASNETPKPAGPSVLVVIDVQNGVMSGAYDADGVIERIGVLLDRARADGVPVVYVQHSDEELIEGSDAWRIVDAIAPRDGEPVIGKHYPDSFVGTTFRETIDGLGARHLVIAGAQTDWCIRSTSLRTLVEGYDLTLVEDCHTTEDTKFDDVRAGVVEISALTTIANTNMYFCWLSYPGQISTIATHDAVQFA